MDTAGWKTMNLPQNWEKVGGELATFDGVLWYRRSVDVPAAAAGKDMKISLGPVDDRDTTFFNGVQVGATNDWRRPRTYKVPGKLVKAGRNVVAVRVLDTAGGGGVYGKAAQMTLTPGGGKAIPLAGAWLYKVGAPVSKLPAPPKEVGGGPNVVTVLYNGMIAPLLPCAIKGAIWYQGESNASRPIQYRRLLPTMIGDWRDRFGVGKFPFFIVELANFMAVQTQPAEGGWAMLREAQMLTARNDPNVGLAVITDVGDARDIHPKNKQDVGKRLALSALSIAYGEALVHSGPIYREMKVDGAKVRLTFDQVGGGLVAKGGEKLKGFAIAGADKQFVWADAVMDGETVVVSSPKVPKPTAVRYNWASNPIGNLFNKAHLPAGSFRTDVSSEK
jgi:sialate O-acetylesterase